MSSNRRNMMFGGTSKAQKTSATVVVFVEFKIMKSIQDGMSVNNMTPDDYMKGRIEKWNQV